MRIAVVHDWLNQKDGGAEVVLRDILSLYPKADVYTLIFNKKKFSDISNQHKVNHSFLQYFPGFLKNRPYFLLPFIKPAINQFKLLDYDLVISNSGAWSKNVNVPDSIKHLCYCQSPARMLWVDWPKYLDSFRQLKYIPFAKLLIIKLCSHLRVWDYYQSQQKNIIFVANSHYVAERIKKFYHREAKVIYPGIDAAKFTPHKNQQKDNYYVIVSTLAKYKNIDLAIKAAIKANKILYIAGSGADQARLESLIGSSDNIHLLGRVTEQEKIKLLQRAQAFIFTSIEDFGITPIEALAAGTAVIALRGGGLAETIKQNTTGIFFDEATTESLLAAIKKFESGSFDTKVLIDSAKNYDKERFNASFKQI